MVGGCTAHVMTRHVLAKVLTNAMAEHFSWAGKKAKRTFKNLGLAQLIMSQYILYNCRIRNTSVVSKVKIISKN